MFYFSYGMFRPMKLHVGKILEDVVTGKRQWAIPAWSLSALLEVIPKEELIDLSVSKDNYWFCSGVHFDTPIYSNPIDAAYAQVKWLLEQGLIKKGDKQ